MLKLEAWSIVGSTIKLNILISVTLKLLSISTLSHFNLKRMKDKWLICVLYFQFSVNVGCLCVLVNCQVCNKKKQLVNWTSTAYKDITF